MFSVPEKGTFECAKKAAVSLVTSTHNYSDHLTRILLETYFATPRFLRTNDIFCTNVKEFAPEFFYTNECPNLTRLYFKVNLVDDKFCPGKYILKGETELVQQNNVRSYVPKQTLHETTKVEFEFAKNYKDNCPPGLHTSLLELEKCVAPFLQKGKKSEKKLMFEIKKSFQFL